MKNYLYRVLVAFDMLCNVAFFGGVIDETISAHAGRMAARKRLWAQILNWFLNKIQPDHCRLAEKGDLQRAQTVVDLESKA